MNHLNHEVILNNNEIIERNNGIGELEFVIEFR
jgi:hypothetical protein